MGSSAGRGEPRGELTSSVVTSRCFGNSWAPGVELHVCSQSQEHLSCLCFSHCCFLGSTGVRNQSSTGSLSPVWERDLSPLEKTLPCHRSSMEVVSSVCDIHPQCLTSHLRPVPSAAATSPGFCDAVSADLPGTHGPMIRTTSQNNTTTGKRTVFAPGSPALCFWILFSRSLCRWFLSSPCPCVCTYLACR